MKRLIIFAVDCLWLVLALLTVISDTQLPKLHINISADSMLEKASLAWGANV